MIGRFFAPSHYPKWRARRGCLTGVRHEVLDERFFSFARIDTFLMEVPLVGISERVRTAERRHSTAPLGLTIAPNPG
jgi:hypothetical protein